MPKSINKKRSKWFKWQAFRFAISGAALGLLLNFASSALYESIASFLLPSNQAERLLERAWWLLQTGAILFLLSILIAYFIAIPAAKKAFPRTNARLYAVDGDSRPSRALILTLSPTNRDMLRDALQAAASDGDPKSILEAICDPNGSFNKWNWQQPLRLLHYNYEKIEIVVWILSSEAMSYFSDIEQLFKRLGPKNLAITKIRHPVLINEYNPVDEALDEAITLCLDHGKMRKRDICIDITSGTKAYSAAATVKTLNTPVVFSYVYTHDISKNPIAESKSDPRAQAGKVVVYDAFFEI